MVLVNFGFNLERICSFLQRVSRIWQHSLRIELGFYTFTFGANLLYLAGTQGFWEFSARTSPHFRSGVFPFPDEKQYFNILFFWKSLGGGGAGGTPPGSCRRTVLCDIILWSFPQKSANHIYPFLFHTVLMKRFWCRRFADWLNRNDMLLFEGQTINLISDVFISIETMIWFEYLVRL